VKLVLGKKLGMTQVFDEAGEVTGVTVLEVGPCTVVQVRTEDRDGYRAAQIGFGTRRESRVKKPEMGHLKKAGVAPVQVLKESALADDEEVAPGDVVKVEDVFASGDLVDVIGTSKGRGFSGTIKRHGFSRGPMSHGSKNVREPGSTGMHTYPGRIFKGKKMSGQYGNKQKTIKNLEVVEVDAESNRLLVKGGVPGPNGGIVWVQVAKTPPAKGS
jgi:large subunit ribosomal protein L3